MSDYQLIAFDMDGTLLNSSKELTEGAISAINRAFDAGKEVVLCTGRSVPECSPFFPMLPRMKYCVCCSGAQVKNLQTGGTVYSREIPTETIRRLFEVGTHEDCMIHLLGDDSVVQEKDICRMDYFNMGVYQSHFYNICRIVPDSQKDLEEHPISVYKQNLYHHTLDGRERSRKRAESLGLTLTDSEIASLECTMPGANKGTGLQKLAEYLGLGREQLIGVGDADNDLDMLRFAGLAVAMGNANDHVKTIADVIVADCDHEGAAEAIDRYLLG